MRFRILGYLGLGWGEVVEQDLKIGARKHGLEPLEWDQTRRVCGTRRVFKT